MKNLDFEGVFEESKHTRYCGLLLQEGEGRPIFIDELNAGRTLRRTTPTRNRVETGTASCRSSSIGELLLGADADGGISSRKMISGAPYRKPQMLCWASIGSKNSHHF